MQNYITSKIDIDEWQGIRTFEKEGIEAAVNQMDAGNGIFPRADDEQVEEKIFICLSQYFGQH